MKAQKTQLSRHEARLLVDKEIADVTARMQNSIRLLKTRRNDLSPAVDIPDEILLEIFLTIRDVACDSGAPHSWYLNVQTCQHWRRVAVSSPALWTCIHSTSWHAFIPLMLERSQKAPIHVNFSGSLFRNSSGTAVAKLIMLEIERIRTASFFGTGDLLRTFQNMLARAGRRAMLLEELTVAISNDDPNCPVFTLDALRPTSRLQTLCLQGARYSWDMLPFASLTNLTLHGKEASTGVSAAQFTDALCRMPHLEFLSIFLSNIPLFQYARSIKLQPIHLPHLEELIIHNYGGRQDLVETFMSQIVHPRLYQLTINLRKTVMDHSTMFRLIGSSMKNGAFESLSALDVDLQELRIYSTLGPPDSHSLIKVVFGDNPDDVEVSHFRFVAEIISCCVTPIDSSNILSLECVSVMNLELTAEQFTNLFGSLPHLKVVHTDYQLPLFDALEIPPKSDNQDTDSRAPIPFSKLRSIRWQPLSTGLSETDFRSLFNCLSTRKAHGVAISRLHLIGPRNCIAATWRKQLRDVVTTVIVRPG